MNFGHFTDGGAKTEGILVGDHGRPMQAIVTKHPVDNVVALVPGKIDVDVRRILAAGIQKSLEE